jgi:hypothetical protein
MQSEHPTSAEDVPTSGELQTLADGILDEFVGKGVSTREESYAFCRKLQKIIWKRSDFALVRRSLVQERDRNRKLLVHYQQETEKHESRAAHLVSCIGDLHIRLAEIEGHWAYRLLRKLRLLP